MHLVYSSRYMMNMIRKNWNDQYLLDEITADDYKIHPSTPADAFDLLERFDLLMQQFV